MSGVVARASSRVWWSAADWTVLAGAAAVLFVGLGAASWDTGDVSRYARMVLEMHHAQTLVPTLGGQPYHEAAPLAAWAPYATAWALGGLSPLAVRLPSALSMFAICVLALALGRVCSARAGRIAVAAIVLNALTLGHGRESRVDALLAFAVSGAVIAFFAATRAASMRRQLLLYLLAGASAALAIAAKGPAAAALIGAALGPVLLYEGRWRALAAGGAVAGAVAVGLTAAWLVPYLRYLGPAESEAFYKQFLLLETLDKVTRGYGKALPFWTYAVEMLPKLAPWSLLGAAALWRILRRPGAASGVERLCTSWLLFPILLLSAASGKHIRYLLPMLPALAVLAGSELDRWLDALARRPLRGLGASLGAIGALLTAVGLAAPIALTWLYGASAYAFAAGICSAIAGVAVLRQAPPERVLSPGPLYIAAVSLVVFVYAGVLPLPVIARQSSYVRLAEAVAPNLQSGDRQLWIVQPDDPRQEVTASQLALYLDDCWVDSTTAEAAPPEGLILASGVLPRRSVRARITWQRKSRGPPETWYLLEAVAERSSG